MQTIRQRQERGYGPELSRSGNESRHQVPLQINQFYLKVLVWKVSFFNKDQETASRSHIRKQPNLKLPADLEYYCEYLGHNASPEPRNGDSRKINKRPCKVLCSYCDTEVCGHDSAPSRITGHFKKNVLKL
ncbi:unnamed protein product [Allacma fusca]|uniref:Uncharacterized protein n=1 Tax=Allacma fusca TaxID=39272 RepID=A0A8J2KT15_9HEXA|nr:unnamed protein product [Allacma fusca]